MKPRNLLLLFVAAIALAALLYAQTPTQPSSSPITAALTQPNNTFNSQTTGTANSAVTITIAGATGLRAQLFSLSARCSAGAAALTVNDGATAIWSTPSGAVTSSGYSQIWHTPLAGSLANQMQVTLSACGTGNTGTVIVQASQF